MEQNTSVIKILLVDDEEDFRRSVSEALERRGFTVVPAEDGSRAIKIIKQDPPNVIILDLNMPGMSGIDTLKKIREIWPDIPVIILTGHGDMNNALSSIAIRVTDFLQKPVDINQ